MTAKDRLAVLNFQTRRHGVIQATSRFHKAERDNTIRRLVVVSPSVRYVPSHKFVTFGNNVIEK